MTETIPGPAYRIETSRLVLRCWQPVDATLLKKAIDANIEHLLPWMNWAENEPTPLQDKIALIRHWQGAFDRDEDFVYGVFLPDESRVLGGCGLHTRMGLSAREIGYWIDKAFNGRGLATELAAALTKVGFEIDGVERIEIHCDENNHASAAIPRKLGYTLDATLRQRGKTVQGAWRNSMIWSLYADEYPTSPAASAPIRAFDAANRLIIDSVR